MIVASAIAAVPATIAAVQSHRARTLTAQTRKENLDQHGASKASLDALADEVRSNRAVLEDVRDMAQAATAEVRVRNRQTLAFSQELWYETDGDGSCTWVNEAWSKAAGIPSQSALGNGWVHGIDLRDIDSLVEDWNFAIRHGKEFGPHQFRFRTGVAVESRALPMYAPTGAVNGYIGRAIVLSNDN